MSVGPTRGPYQRPSGDRDLAELFQRVEDLERVAPPTPPTLQTSLIDAYFGAFNGPTGSGTNNPIFPSNAMIPLHYFSKHFIGPSFDPEVGDDTAIGCKAGVNGSVYVAVATLFFTGDPTGARVHISGGGPAALVAWTRGVPYGPASPFTAAQTLDVGLNCLQASCVFNVNRAGPDDIAAVIVYVENAMGMELTSFPITFVSPGASNLVIYPVAKTYTLA